MTERAMSDAQRQAVADWITATAPRLLLADCKITVSADPPDPEPNSWADTTIDHYHDVTIRVCAHLLEEPADRIQSTLVHELTHIHHGDLKMAMYQCLASVDQPIRDVAMATLDRYVERMVDQIARVLVNAGIAAPVDRIKDAAPALGAVA